MKLSLFSTSSAFTFIDCFSPRPFHIHAKASHTARLYGCVTRCECHLWAKVRITCTRPGVNIRDLLWPPCVVLSDGVHFRKRLLAGRALLHYQLGGLGGHTHRGIAPWINNTSRSRCRIQLCWRNRHHALAQRHTHRPPTLKFALKFKPPNVTKILL